MRSKIGSKILGLAIALALVGELSNVLNFLTIRNMYNASLTISEDTVTSIRNLENLRSNLDHVLSPLFWTKTH